MNKIKKFNIEESLGYKLKKYVDTDIYPFHMPGHKRNMPEYIKKAIDDIYKIDLTELDYTDDLHRPEGIIKEALNYAKEVYKTKKTYFLVNGSTCGIHIAMRTVAKENKKIVFVKNAHFSAYNALELNRIEPIYIEVEKDKLYDINFGVDIERIEEVLEKEKVDAVYLTSPTYDGIISDIESIANICHKKGSILIVDEAHGAHLQFINRKMSALSMGADIVIQSLHKTLPSFTQTALLHINSDRISLEEIERNLSIFETSSPSYIFTSIIDACIRYSNEYASEQIKDFKENLKEFRKKEYKNFEIFDIKNLLYKVKYLDETKILICIKNSDIDAKSLIRILREEYNLEFEMCKERYILALTSYLDTKEGFERLEFALRDLDERLDKNIIISERKNTLEDEKKKKYLEKYIDRILENNIFIYPPGVPLLKKGEILKKEDYEKFSNYIDLGYKLVVY